MTFMCCVFFLRVYVGCFPGEWISGAVCMYIVDQMVTLYDESDPQVCLDYNTTFQERERGT